MYVIILKFIHKNDIFLEYVLDTIGGSYN